MINERELPAHSLFDPLPETPVDLYKVEWWEVSDSGVHHCFAVYHEKRTWLEYSGDAGWGAPLNDCWMVHDLTRGRGLGWDWIKSLMLHNSRVYTTRHATKLEAVQQWRKNTQREVTRLTNHLNAATKLWAAACKQLEELS